MKPSIIVGPLAALVPLLLVLAVACGGAATPKPAYWPTFGDYKVVFGQKLGEDKGPWPIYDVDYLAFASVYSAFECVAGRELSREGFHAFLAQSPLYREPLSRTRSDVIGQMLALSRTGAKLDCLRPYLYPETPAEALLAADLVAPYDPLAYWWPEFGRHGIEDQAYAWLRSKEERGEPLLQVLSQQQVLFDWEKKVEIPTQVTVPKNTTGLPIQAWAFQRELWKWGMVVDRIEGQR